MVVEVEVLYAQALRLLSRAEKGQRPGPESSIDKLNYSEMDKRHQELVQSILGPYGQLEDGLSPELALHPDGVYGQQDASWTYNFLRSRAGTIYSGSSEIQKNIIGERVLGLPREPRADRSSMPAARQG
jgi:alkylation response protein AidB-like acyl-CoA dehydrogenase